MVLFVLAVSMMSSSCVLPRLEEQKKECLRRKGRLTGCFLALRSLTEAIRCPRSLNRSLDFRRLVERERAGSLLLFVVISCLSLLIIVFLSCLFPAVICDRAGDPWPSLSCSLSHICFGAPFCRP